LDKNVEKQKGVFEIHKKQKGVFEIHKKQKNHFSKTI